MASKRHINPDYLPPKAGEIADLIGLPALMRLVEWRGGVYIYIHKIPKEKHELVQCIGIRAAERLAEIYGGDRLEIPNCATSIRKMIHDEIREARKTKTENQVAAEYSMWGRSIRRINAAQEKDDSQGELFD